jgi:hypothetical protein
MDLPAWSTAGSASPLRHRPPARRQVSERRPSARRCAAPPIRAAARPGGGGGGGGGGSDEVPEALHVLNVDMNLPISALPLLDAAARAAEQAEARARKLHPTRCATVAHTLTEPDWQWALDQAVYDAGCRLFVASHGALRVRELHGRLPSDARYWALVPAATLLRRAARVVGMLRGSRGMVEMVGIVEDVATLQALQNAAEEGSKAAAREVPLLVGGKSCEACVQLAREVAGRYGSLRVAGVMFDGNIAATAENGIASFMADMVAAGARDGGAAAPLVDLVVGSEFAGVWREQLAKPGLHKCCRVVLYTPIAANGGKGK